MADSNSVTAVAEHQAPVVIDNLTKQARKRKASRRKAHSDKPHPDFPLSPRKDGRWAKKVRQKVFIFAGTAEEALAEWNRSKDYIFEHGRKPPSDSPDGFTVEDLCDSFTNAKKRFVASGELTKRKYDEYFDTCKRMLATFGKTTLAESLRPDDFEKFRAKATERWGVHRVANEVQHVRTVFKYGYEAGHLDKPARFGPDFKKPSKKTLRLHRAAKGHRMIEAADLRKLITAAGVPLKAMILLALNGGFGNADAGRLPQTAVDLVGGWVRFPRPKTGIERRFPLWPETTKAIRAAIAARPDPNEEEAKELVFVTKYGGAWSKAETRDNPVTKEFRKLLNDLKLHRPGLGFYSLRHVFETIAGEAKDQVAVDHIMGHAREDMATVYRERISDGRLKAVTDHIYSWLFPPKKAKTSKAPTGKRGAK